MLFSKSVCSHCTLYSFLFFPSRWRK